MTHENKKQAILEKIREVCPELTAQTFYSFPEQTYGLPVQLNHLLIALGNIEKNIACDMHIMVLVINHNLYPYNLTLTVEQNLDNEALTDLIYELIV